MEIDLNQTASEVGKNAYCHGNCEEGRCNCCLSSSTSSCSSNSSSTPASSSTYLELWHACAGPLTSLPKKGNAVVYFPQGHLEQIASASPFSPMNMATFDLQPQILCKVINVHLLANKENDEVYTQLTLLPLPELLGTGVEGKELEELALNRAADGDGSGGSPTRSTPHMFCKTLTASDTSTHGGFSVPRRAAEDCFPPLDYTQLRPSQELIAKDLHGVEWRFKHIYRGQPRRHLLTTGWSIFVSQKNLISGDAVLFLRGENGELRLGIRRAVRPRNGLPDSIVGNQNSCANDLTRVVKAVSTKSAFDVFYNPRAYHAQFVVSCQKYVKSINNPVNVGTRFKMRFEMDDSPERRFNGVVVGIGDMDPFRWSNSKWRCLTVRWDKDSDHQERVSPWEIDPSVSLPPLSVQSSPRLKKLRTSLQEAPPNNAFNGRGGFMDFEDSVRSSKVLQGQENVGMVSPFYGCDTAKRSLEFEVRSSAQQNQASGGVEKLNIGDYVTSFTGFMESDRFLKVLQGQEICSLRPQTRKPEPSLGVWGKFNLSDNSFNPFQSPNSSFYHMASNGARNMYYPHRDIYSTGQAAMMSSNDINFPRESALSNPSAKMERANSTPPTLGSNMRNSKDENVNENRTGCKLFGFSLTTETATNMQSSGKRSCTKVRKVHKQGSLVGRAIDLSRLNGYTDLLSELERLFSMEGLLKDPDKGWRVLYTDNENDVMVVGDYPWHDFCDAVSKIHIYTEEEVEKMTNGVISDDTQSCLDQAALCMEASKSSSVGQPDSSPTVVRV
ncbi:auxin response factor 4-like isoform X1 [Cucurbita moschata]|uniref:Auxin response factor n=1 Tax=Cucurbita moschata TaxID=3662 RepID=A0A6J1FTA2_CUCMO|nr:auxin response factor 4-like isoform X1 [Cucurbita moschata]XP_022944016.1 auxin response factor 4-like isoform X1 [Cucurbita moschata]